MINCLVVATLHNFGALAAMPLRVCMHACMMWVCMCVGVRACVCMCVYVCVWHYPTWSDRRRDRTYPCNNILFTTLHPPGLGSLVSQLLSTFKTTFPAIIRTYFLKETWCCINTSQWFRGKTARTVVCEVNGCVLTFSTLHATLATKVYETTFSNVSIFWCNRQIH